VNDEGIKELSEFTYAVNNQLNRSIIFVVYRSFDKRRDKRA
jgi:hypothetical protein